jgi:hypothetical protein
VRFVLITDYYLEREREGGRIGTRIMSNSRTTQEDPYDYDPDAAAELFFAQQKAREEARAKLPTDDWIQIIAMVMMKSTTTTTDATKNDDAGSSSSSSTSSSSSPSTALSSAELSSLLVTTMPPPPSRDVDGMIVLDATVNTLTIDTVNNNDTTELEKAREKTTMLSPEEHEARRRIMEVLVHHLEKELVKNKTKKEVEDTEGS